MDKIDMETLSISCDDCNQKDCQFCTQDLLRFDRDDPDHEKRNQLMRLLFHGACSIHDRGTNDTEQLLCEFCRHLRLRHLLGCLNGAELPFDYIRFCSFGDIEKRQECRFCELLIRSGMPYSYFSGITSPAKFEGAHLEISVGSASIGMRLKYPDGSWMGARQVYWTESRTKSPSRCKGYTELASDGWINAEDKEKDLAVYPGSRRSHRRARDKPRRIGGYVDWSLLRQWLDSCSLGHPECTPKHFGEGPAAFRLIDVRRRRIISATFDCNYVALSYVWGSKPDHTKMTTRETLSSLEEDGGLIPANTPKTINDAMTICCQLQQDYLWVDQYCIVQDDDEDKKEQISSMAAIYSCAVFVIITTDGVMSDGIPGVSYERPQKQLQCQIVDIEFSNTVPSWREITLGASLWSTRGWTYQEVILGRRKLYFTSAQSFFECDESILCEDGSEHQALYSPNGLHPQVWEPNLHCYYGHVRNYSGRHLGSSSDIYSAIEGVASALYKKKSPLWFGLPRYDFDLALLWCPDSANSQADGRPELKDVPKELIPSWSWSSTRQSVLLLDDENRRQIQFCGPLVSWAALKQTGDMETIVPSSAVEYGCLHCDASGDSVTGEDNACDERYIDEKLLYMAVAWSQGCMESECPFPTPGEAIFSSLKSSVISRWPCKYRYWQDVFQRQNSGGISLTSSESLSRESTSVDTLPSSPKQSSVIITRAQSAFFRLNVPTDQSLYLRDYPIIDETGDTVGVLIGQDPDLQAALSADVNACERLEFLALSVSQLNGIIQPDATTQYRGFQYGDHREEAERSLKDLTYFDKEGTPLLPLPVVNVMLIRRNRSTSNAHRLSVGWIYLTKWIQARPEFKTVALE